MPSIHVYEPALCCNTGVCGPDPAQDLVTFTADLSYLSGRGADIARHNLAGDVQAFADSEPVRAFLQVAGSEGLPLVLVDGLTVLTGRYPSRAELLRWARLEPDHAGAGLAPAGQAPAGGCCGSSTTPPPDGCCASSEPTPEAPCCAGSPEPDSAQACCGGTGGATSVQACCATTAVESEVCCGGHAPAPPEQTCCGGTRPTQTCCGGDSPEASACC